MSDLSHLYHPGFYSNQRDGSLGAARKILPRVFEFLSPQAVVDVGCGVGTWLVAARESGARRAVGLEGEWVSRSELAGEGLELILHDLEQPIPIHGPFDLAMSLEVAEHLTPERAPDFVAELCSLAPAVLFGAAIPGQGGVNHINEQWQDYWASSFLQHGYEPLDLIRPIFWDDRSIPIHYRQNTFLYLSKSARHRAAESGLLPQDQVPWPLNLVHPGTHMNNYHEMTAPPTLPEALRITASLPICVIRAVRARLPKSSRSPATEPGSAPGTRTGP